MPRPPYSQLLPLGQLAWHLNVSVCRIRDSPYLQRALACNVGTFFAVSLVGVGIIGNCAMTRGGLLFRIRLMRVVSGAPLLRG